MELSKGHTTTQVYETLGLAGGSTIAGGAIRSDDDPN
jgi:hypothetical protein